MNDDSPRAENTPAPASHTAPTATAILGAVARGWCHEKNASKVMDPDLAIAIGAEVSALLASHTSAPPPLPDVPSNANPPEFGTLSATDCDSFPFPEDDEGPPPWSVDVAWDGWRERHKPDCTEDIELAFRAGWAARPKECK